MNWHSRRKKARRDVDFRGTWVPVPPRAHSVWHIFPQHLSAKGWKAAILSLRLARRADRIEATCNENAASIGRG